MLTVRRMAAGERYKGFNEVIDVLPQLLERFPDLKYLIVGDDSDRHRLEAKEKVLGLSNYVIFAAESRKARKSLTTVSRHAELWRGFRHRLDQSRRLRNCDRRELGRWLACRWADWAGWDMGL